jgi:hypothetical protein
MQPKIDQFNWPYFSELPEEYRPGTIKDLFKGGVAISGRPYLIQWDSKPDYYECRRMHPGITQEYLIPFILVGRLFVKY